eukprot:6202902-Pleurochrysis_carterae.AAC.2
MFRHCKVLTVFRTAALTATAPSRPDFHNKGPEELLSGRTLLPIQVVLIYLRIMLSINVLEARRCTDVYDFHTGCKITNTAAAVIGRIATLSSLAQSPICLTSGWLLLASPYARFHHHLLPTASQLSLLRKDYTYSKVCTALPLWLLGVNVVRALTLFRKFSSKRERERAE